MGSCFSRCVPEKPYIEGVTFGSIRQSHYYCLCLRCFTVNEISRECGYHYVKQTNVANI